MRILQIIILLFLSSFLFSQNPRLFILSSNNKFSDSSQTLLLNSKNYPFFLKRNTSDFSDVKKIEIKDISDAVSLEQISQKTLNLIKVESLVFNNCDLLSFSQDYSSLKNLRIFQVTNNSLFNINDVIVSLKNNPNLNTLLLSSDEFFELPDSIHLLKEIKTLVIKNSDVKPNAATKKNLSTISYTTSGGIKTLQIEQVGFVQPLYIENISEVEKSNLAFSNKFIRPVIKNINDSIYYISSDTDSELEYASGTKIFIQNNSFKTISGSDFVGEAKILYREFRNPVDFFLSGIPMSDFENKDTNVFVSAGMYEIWAFDQNDERLKLKQDKNIIIDFKPIIDTGEYRFYSLDTANGKWNSSKQSVKLRGKTKETKKESTGINEFLRERRWQQNKIPDHTLYENRFSKLDYINTYHIKNYFFNKDSTKYSLSENEDKSKFTSCCNLKFKKITKNGTLIFEFFCKGYGNYDKYGLQGKTLKYNGPPLTKKEFKEKFTKKIFNEIQIQEQGNYLVLKLKTRHEIKDLPFNIIRFEDDKINYTVNTKDEHRIARLFKNRLRITARTFNRRNKKLENWKYYDYVRGFNKDTANRLSYNIIKHYLSQEEKTMAYATFIKLADSVENVRIGSSVISGYKFNSSLDTIAVRANGILINSNMGFNNLDYYLHKNLVQDVFVQYTFGDRKEKLITEYANTIVPGINTSIGNYNVSTTPQSIKVRYIKKKDFILLRLDADGYMQADKINSNKIDTGVLTLSLDHKISIKDKTSAEISNLIGL